MHVRLRFALHEVELQEGRTTIGRDSTCTITLDGPAVSREHASIELLDGIATIFDLNSRNGVFVDGRRIARPTTLLDGSRVRIGGHELVAQVVALPQPSRRITGKGITCAGCGDLYSTGLDACPACGLGLD